MGGAGGSGATAGWFAVSGRSGGGVCAGLATHLPFLKSCQGKQPLSVAIFRIDCASTGEQMEKARQIKTAALAEMRAMQKPRRIPKIGRKSCSLCYWLRKPGESKGWLHNSSEKAAFFVSPARFASAACSG
jgi:hypothetical protein